MGKQQLLVDNIESAEHFCGAKHDLAGALHNVNKLWWTVCSARLGSNKVFTDATGGVEIDELPVALHAHQIQRLLKFEITLFEQNKKQLMRVKF